MKKGLVAFGGAFVGSVAGGALAKKVWRDKYHAQKTELETVERERDVTYIWLMLELRGIRLTDYFEAHGLKTVAVFGMGRIGRRAAEELGEHVTYGVEAENFAAVHERFLVYRLGDDLLPPADCMLLCDLERVPEKLAVAREEFSADIVTLAEVLQWLLKEHKLEPRDGAIANWPPTELLDAEKSKTKEERL